LERISKEAGSMIGYHEEYRRPNLNIKPLPEVVEDATIISLTNGSGPKLNIHKRTKSTTVNILEPPNLKDLIDDIDK
jgi:hypothetical protein